MTFYSQTNMLNACSMLQEKHVLLNHGVRRTSREDRFHCRLKTILITTETNFNDYTRRATRLGRTKGYFFMVLFTASR
jgi:hypothetical protein